MSSRPPQPGSFSLFPRPPSRSQDNGTTPARSVTPTQQQEAPSKPTHPPRSSSLARRPAQQELTTQATPPRTKASQPRPVQVSDAPDEDIYSAPEEDASPRRGRGRDVVVPSGEQRPAPEVEPPVRSETAFSSAPTLVRSSSNRSRSSIAKRPLPQEDDATPAAVPIKSIFPTYNPDVPLANQSYYPTQTSPRAIPPATISRRLYASEPEQEAEPESHPRNFSNPMRSPMSATSTRTQTQQATARKWPPPRANETPVEPEPSTTEQLKEFWKVTNGWKAPTYEGRLYCFKMTAEKDSPIYTLASATQPFYSLRLDPTSVSAYVSLSRYDPNRPFKGPTAPPAPDSNSSSSLSRSKQKEYEPAKGWQEALKTTLEPESRKHRPDGDGLVALLYPTAATKMALERGATDHTAMINAERECARLVWDDDTGNHYLVHPCLAMPFVVTVERDPTWSRTEYTLEHIESPQHLARLTLRDGSGCGWMEVDTGIAAKIDAVYLVDVAVTALALVAHGDGAFARVEVFEPPPVVFGSPSGSVFRSGSRQDDRDRRGRGSRASSRKDGKKDSKKKGRSRIEEFDMDLESASSEFAGFGKMGFKEGSVDDDEKMPGLARALIKLLTITFKCFVWTATILFKALTGCVSLLARCLTSEKL